MFYGRSCRAPGSSMQHPLKNVRKTLYQSASSDAQILKQIVGSIKTLPVILIQLDDPHEGGLLFVNLDGCLGYFFGCLGYFFVGCGPAAPSLWVETPT